MNLHCYFIFPKIYPTFCLTICLILGIWWQVHEPYWYWSLVIASIGTTTLIILRRKCLAFKLEFILFYVAAFFLGCFTCNRTLIAQRNFCTYTNGKNFDVMGTVIDINPTTNPYLRYSLRLKLKELVSTLNPSCRYRGKETLCVYTQSLHNITVADTICIHNVHFKTPKNIEFMQFLLKENIASSACVTKCTITMINRPFFSWARSISQYRDNLIEGFKQCMDSKTFLAFSSIFLGNPLAKKREDVLKNQLKIWGLFHYIARAGLHLVIFVSIWIFILNLLPIPWSIRKLCIILLCSVYFICTWPSIPFNRAFFTLLLVKVCELLRFKTYYIPSLAVITFITLLENPIALFALDFQLSFGVTFALAWFNEMRTQTNRN